MLASNVAGSPAAGGLSHPALLPYSSRPPSRPARPSRRSRPASESEPAHSPPPGRGARREGRPHPPPPPRAPWSARRSGTRIRLDGGATPSASMPAAAGPAAPPPRADAGRTRGAFRPRARPSAASAGGCHVPITPARAAVGRSAACRKPPAGSRARAHRRPCRPAPQALFSLPPPAPKPSHPASTRPLAPCACGLVAPSHTGETQGRRGVPAGPTLRNGGIITGVRPGAAAAAGRARIATARRPCGGACAGRGGP